MNHDVWWPGVVVELSLSGVANIKYLQNGWIRGLETWTVGNSELLFISGVSNELNRPTVALIEQEGPAASAPTQAARFNCDLSPTGKPLRVFALPNFDVLDGAPYAFALNPVRLQGEVRVDLSEGISGAAIAEFFPDLATVRLTLSDGYWSHHKRIEKAGRLDHSTDSCPEIVKPHAIDVWSAGSGWVRNLVKAGVRR